MLLGAMVAHHPDHSPQIAELASINEIPGNMPGKCFLPLQFDPNLNAIPGILNSHR